MWIERWCTKVNRTRMPGMMDLLEGKVVGVTTPGAAKTWMEKSRARLIVLGVGLEVLRFSEWILSRHHYWLISWFATNPRRVSSWLC